ncbi:MAG: ABC transporter permease [Chloroflexi bacterium]|nr:ABC transporter permease [Chloroflexota bacterium]
MNFKTKLSNGIKYLQKNKSFSIGLGIVLITIFIAIFADSLTPHVPSKLNPKFKLLPPFWVEGGNPKYILGTDAIGRDLLSRLIKGIQMSVGISLFSVLSSILIGTTIGVISGLVHPSWLDSVLMRITDIQMGFPFIVLAIIILTMVDPTPFSCIIVLTLSAWPTYARVIRSSVMIEKSSDYVDAAKAMGASRARIAIKYIGRNLLPTIIPVAPMDIASVVITESLLSFMQIGIQPPLISLGNIMSDGRNYISTHWWITAIPGFVIMIIVIGLNLVGDTLQTTFDPKLKQ